MDNSYGRGYAVSGQASQSGGTLSGAAMNAVEVKRSSQVEEWLKRNEAAIESLERGIGNLNSRIAPISRGVPPESNDKSAPEEMLVPLASELRGMHRRLAALVRYVDGIAQSVEV